MKDSTQFPHALEFETDGEIPSVEGAADGWQETVWTIDGASAPSLSVAGGVMTVDTVGVGGGHDLRLPVGTSAWAAEVGPDTSYTFEARLKVTAQGGSDPGFTFWLGNGVAAETAVVQVRTDEVMYGRTTQVLHEGDNAAEFVTVRIAHDGETGLHTIYRNGVAIGSDLGPSDLQHGNNWVILVDFGGANEVAAVVDYVRWDATGAYEPDDGTRDASELAHKLLFETDGELPSVEGAADGWGERAWHTLAGVSASGRPTLEVSGGWLRYDSFTGDGTSSSGGEWIQNGRGSSAWAGEVVAAGASYTLEVSIRVTSAAGGGTILWVGNGSNLLNLKVSTDALAAGGGFGVEGLDNSSAPVTLRLAYDASAGTYDIWHDEALVGDDVTPADGNDDRMILIDCCSSLASAGEIDYVRWTAAGALDPSTASSTFAHALEFETDGELPQFEGAADGWTMTGGWKVDGAPPSLDVVDGLLQFDTFTVNGGTGGAPDIHMEGGSAWEAEVVTPGASFTLEVGLRVLDASSSGVALFLGSGSRRLILNVSPSAVLTNSGEGTLHEGDNASELVAIRVGFDSATARHYVWRNGILIGDGLEAQAHGDARCILLDTSSGFAIRGELDYVCWEAGLYPPPDSGEDNEAPAPPTGLVAEAGVSTVSLDWDSNSEDDVAGYNVYRSETSGGPHALLADGVGQSAFVDDTVANGTEYFYVVTAVDASENESDASDEASATPGFGGEAEADAFGHCLHFEVDGELPNVEGVADGVMLDASWNATPDVPPTMTVSDGLVHFESALPGQHAITMTAGSAWNTEVGASGTYTIEASLSVTSATQGFVFWVEGGGRRLILRVDTNGIFTWDGAQLHEGDNASRLVLVRVGYEPIGGLYYVWRNGILIGDGVAPSASTGDARVFLIDCCSSTQATGAMDYLCWDATGIYPPASIVDEVPPAAPTGLAATGGIGAVMLDWDSNAEDDLASYNAYRSESPGGPYELIAEGVGSSDYVDTTAINGTTYHYVVTAVDGSDNESDASDEASAAPSAPDELGASTFAHCLLFETNGELPSVEGAGDGWAEDASWNQNDPDPPTLAVFGGRLIFDSALAGQHAITMWEGSAWEAEIDASVSYTMELDVKVNASAGDASGVTVWLANGSTRLILRVDTNGVYTWAGDELDASDNSAEFATIRVGYDALGGLYYVWRNGVLIGDGVPPSGSTARTAVFLIDCCTSVQVTGEFDSVCWTADGIYGPDLTAPDAPTGLGATGGEGEVALDWDDNADADLAAYDVLRSEMAGGPYDVIASDVATSSYVDTDVVNGTTYHYVVVAVDTSGNLSGASNEASATPEDVTAPSAPTGLMAVGGDAEVILDWDDNAEADLASYSVLRSETTGGPYTEVASGLATSDWVDTAVVNGTTYYYVVTATDTADNESDESVEAEATPLEPGGLQLPGDCNQDGEVDVSDALCLFGFLFTGVTPELPCGDGSIDDPANLTLLNYNAGTDQQLDISDGIAALGYLFLGGPPHALGEECIRIVDCADVCTP